MRALLLFALLICLPTSPAISECRMDVHAAFSKFESFGSFHFQQTLIVEDEKTTSTGKVVPGTSWHIKHHDGPRGGITEQVRIGKLSWSKDAFGWFHPKLAAKHLPNQVTPAAPLVPTAAGNTKCLGHTKIDGVMVEGFERAHWMTPNTVEALFVEALSGWPLQYEATDTSRRTHIVTRYTYDQSITVDPPTVDTVGRREQSLAALNEAQAKSDPACRTELLGAIQHGETAGPFRFEVSNWHIAGQLWTGEVVPSNAFRLKSTHRSSSEKVIIGNRIWTRIGEGEWESRRDTSEIPHTFEQLRWLLQTPTGLIGLVECAGYLIKDNHTYRRFEYQLYEDRNGAYLPTEDRVVFIDPEARVPVRTQTVHEGGTIGRLEIREYDKSIVILPPR